MPIDVIGILFVRIFPPRKASQQARSGSMAAAMAAEGRKYDVFISHCGKDSKRNLAIMLKTELERAGLPCFLDERDLRLGDPAAETMLAAMQTAKFGVVILTEGFFRREWCLKELETFLERGNCIPVFLTPFEELRAIAKECLSSRVWESFDKFGYTRETYEGLVERAFGITGLRLEAKDGFWDLCFEELKYEFLQRLGKLEGGVRTNPGQTLFGIEHHLMAVKALMGVGATEAELQSPGGAQEVGIVAVKGMGGVGKTTLAKLVYDDPEVRGFFGGRVCWLVVNQNPISDKVRRLQEQVLSELGNAKDVKIGNPDIGRAQIRERLRGTKVLICLDDVWAGMQSPIVCKEDLGPGSCILKTTRDANTIEPGGRQHDLDVLSPEAAKHLFCLKAFGEQEPLNEFAALVDESLGFCGGLPLALEVVGSAVAKMLAGSNGKSDWHDFLVVIRGRTTGGTSVGADIYKALQTSYDVLHQDEKDAFVLIAAMWGNDSFQWTADMWSKPSHRLEETELVCSLAAVISGRKGVAEARSYARSVLKELEGRSLLRLETGASGQRRAIIHDLLVDIAVGVTQSPEMHTRFCRWVDKDVPIQRAALQVEHVAIASSAPFQLPSTFFADNKVVSPMVDESFVGFSSSWFSTFKRTQRFNQCRLLALVNCTKLRSLPRSIGQQAGLIVLRLLGCWQLKGFPESICQLTCLQVLVLDSCTGLKSLPQSIGRLTSLTKLDIQSCFLLKVLPESVGHLTHLTEIDLRGCFGLKGLPISIGRLTDLVKMDLSWCKRLKGLPESFGQLMGLTKLDLSVSSRELTELPESFGQLAGLTDLNLRRCESLKALPESFGQLAGLRKLDFSQCSALKALPESFGQLAGLVELDMEGCKSLKALPESFGQLVGLTKLMLGSCFTLESLPESFVQLTRLEVLNLQDCGLRVTDSKLEELRRAGCLVLPFPEHQFW
jgi:hypothetical protein